MSYSLLILKFFLDHFRSTASLEKEIVSLRQQVAVLKGKNPKPKLTNKDRLFWIVISKVFTNWRDALLIVKPETVLRWHRDFASKRWGKRDKPRGRPKVDPQIVKLIIKIAHENPLWGAPVLAINCFVKNYWIFSNITEPKFMAI